MIEVICDDCKRNEGENHLCDKCLEQRIEEAKDSETD